MKKTNNLPLVRTPLFHGPIGWGWAKIQDVAQVVSYHFGREVHPVEVLCRYWQATADGIHLAVWNGQDKELCNIDYPVFVGLIEEVGEGEVDRIMFPKCYTPLGDTPAAELFVPGGWERVITALAREGIRGVESRPDPDADYRQPRPQFRGLVDEDDALTPWASEPRHLKRFVEDSVLVTA